MGEEISERLSIEDAFAPNSRKLKPILCKGLGWTWFLADGLSQTSERAEKTALGSKSCWCNPDKDIPKGTTSRNFWVPQNGERRWTMEVIPWRKPLMELHLLSSYLPIEEQSSRKAPYTKKLIIFLKNWTNLVVITFLWSLLIFIYSIIKVSSVIISSNASVYRMVFIKFLASL